MWLILLKKKEIFLLIINNVKLQNNWNIPFYLVTKMYNCNNWLLSNQSKLYNFRQTKSVSNTEIKS